jgi:hypothetical protein
MLIEYRVRPITRYIITVYTADGEKGGGSQMGTFDRLNDANFVASKLADSERDRLEGGLEGYKVLFTPLSVPGEFSQFD